jgi:hypothetical protein
VAAAGGDGGDGGSMGLGTHGVPARGCPEFWQRVLWTVCSDMSRTVQVT